MRRRLFTFIFLSMVAGCGGTQPGVGPSTSVDAQPIAEPTTSMDALAVLDATSDVTSPYPVVDGQQGRKVIDPQYVLRNFNDLLEGTWLIGWYGGENHFSWIRFPPAGENMFGTAIQVLSPADVHVNQPYWLCSGVGTWSVTQRPATVDLTMPAGCVREILVFETFRPASDSPLAILEADIMACRGSQCDGPGFTKIVGFKFPDNYCDAALATCGSPF